MSMETTRSIGYLLLAIYTCFLITANFEYQSNKKGLKPLIIILVCCMVHTASSLMSDYLEHYHLYYRLQYLVCILYPLSGYLMLYFYGRFYIHTCGASKRTRNHIQIFNMTVLVLNLLCTIPFIPSGLFFSVSKDSYYSRGPLFPLSYIFVVLGLAGFFVITYIVKPSRRRAVGYTFFSILPLFVNVLMLFFSLPSVANDVASMLSCIILFAFVYTEERQKNLQQELKLVEYQSDIMLSRIGPHFIYNTLSTISALCSIDPEQAQRLTADFSDYLRTNLNLAAMQRFSSFQDELSHTEKYLQIEKVRFGDRIQVEYDLQETDFMLPSLSLQPIVENAIKHGITKKDEGGTVRIATHRQGEYIFVTVTDNGVGFDPKKTHQAKGHYGIVAVKDRARMLMDGNLKIESTPGIGTTVTLYVRQTNPENESFKPRVGEHNVPINERKRKP